MLKQLEGSTAVAQGVALCDPEVVSAYPITPQTHIVEALGKMVKSGQLTGCEYLNVESEFAAMSAAIGSSAAGARTYTATASQGILYMAEAVYNAAGLELPIVMTVGNRAIGAPINIWNDHTDSMSMANSGWLQLFVEDNQQAVDVHIQAFRIAETLSLPVMVCMDGFILTHAFEQVDMPEHAQVKQFLPPFVPKQSLDPADPVSMGALVGPEAYTEVRYLAHKRQLDALDLIPEIQRDFNQIIGRDSGGLIGTYCCDDAEIIVVTMGSIVGTFQDVVDIMRAEGVKVGVLSLRSFRPFPGQALRDAVAHTKRILVFEKTLTIGMGGLIAAHVNHFLGDMDIPIDGVIGGLGGRPLTRAGLSNMIKESMKGNITTPHFLELNDEIIEVERAREKAQRRSGSTAENVLKDMGVVSASKTG